MIEGSMIMSPENFHKSLTALVDSWCERRCLSALKFILQGYPLSSGLTDDWANLLKALEDVRAFARDELTQEDAKILGDLIVSTQQIVYRVK
jgi:hypothetical protein